MMLPDPDPAHPTVPAHDDDRCVSCDELNYDLDDDGYCLPCHHALMERRADTLYDSWKDDA